MAGKRAAIGENNAPWQVRCTTPQFAVDEVCQTSEQETQRRDSGDTIGQRPEFDIVAACVNVDGCDNAGKTPMERHAAFPDGEDVARIFEIETRVVEKNIAQTSAENDPQRGP